MRHARLPALALALVLTCSPLSALAAEPEWLVPTVREAPAFADTAGTWCEEEVAVLYETGLMEGISETAFGVENTLMPEHVVVVCARLYSLLTGGDGTLPAPAEDEEWYRPAYVYLAQALDYPGGDDGLMFLFHATKYPAARWHFIDILYQTLEAAGVELPTINQVTAVPDSAEESVLAFYRAGILTGNDEYGTFDGNSTLTRGQAAPVLARLVDPALRQTLSLKSFDLCADVLGVDGKSPALTVEGETITMEQFAQELCLALRQNALESSDAPEPEAALAAAVEEIQEDVAIDRLAAKHHLLMSERKISDTYGSIPAGYQGVTREGWLWEYGHSLLHQELFLLYQAQSGPAVSDGETQGELLFDAALDAARPKDASLSPILTEMDWDAVLERLLSSPFRAL